MYPLTKCLYFRELDFFCKSKCKAEEKYDLINKFSKKKFKKKMFLP